MPPKGVQKGRKQGATGVPNCWEGGPAAGRPSSERAEWFDARLRELRKLFAAGLISAQEYAALRTEALAESENPPSLAGDEEPDR